MSGLWFPFLEILTALPFGCNTVARPPQAYCSKSAFKGKTYSPHQGHLIYEGNLSQNLFIRIVWNQNSFLAGIGYSSILQPTIGKGE